MLVLRIILCHLIRTQNLLVRWLSDCLNVGQLFPDSLLPFLPQLICILRIFKVNIFSSQSKLLFGQRLLFFGIEHPLSRIFGSQNDILRLQEHNNIEPLFFPIQVFYRLVTLIHQTLILKIQNMVNCILNVHDEFESRVLIYILLLIADPRQCLDILQWNVVAYGIHFLVDGENQQAGCRQHQQSVLILIFPTLFSKLRRK